MSYTPIYITTTDVKDKTMSDNFTRAGWIDADIQTIGIQEAETYLESRLCQIGYTRAQLLTAPLFKVLVIKYSKYVCLRDIFTQNAPSKSPGEAYDKWKVEVDAKILDIQNNVSRLVDTNGLVITPINGDSRFKVETTTENVKRAITMDDSSTWNIDPLTYADSDVVGEK